MFFVLLATVYILIGAFSPLIFKVIIDRYVLIDILLLFFIDFTVLYSFFSPLDLFPFEFMVFFSVLFGFLSIEFFALIV